MEGIFYKILSRQEKLHFIDIEEEVEQEFETLDRSIRDNQDLQSSGEHSRQQDHNYFAEAVDKSVSIILAICMTYQRSFPN